MKNLMGGVYREKLNEQGQEIWDRVTSMIEVGKEIYAESLYIYCKEMANYERCQEILERTGLTQVSQTGYEQQRPEVSIGQASLKIAVGIAHKFGFDPYGTRKIVGSDKTKNAQKKSGRTTPMRKVK